MKNEIISKLFATAIVSLAFISQAADMASHPWVEMKIAAAIADSENGTKQWVREYVSTNSTTPQRKPFSPFSATCIDPETGNDIQFSLNFIQADYDAMIVKNSTVDGMTNGTVFAKIGENAYRNTGNTECVDIIGGVEKWGYELSDGRFEYVTNGTSVATNVVYATTNDHYMVRLVAVVGSQALKSVEISKDVHRFVSDFEFGKAFDLVPCKITDKERAELTATKVTFRWVDLIIGSAYAVADYQLPTKWDENGNNPELIKETDDQKIWHQHYAGEALTESGDAVKFGVSSIQWGDSIMDLTGYFQPMLIINGGEYVDEVYEEVLYLYNKGKKKQLIADQRNYIINALEQSLGKAKATQISRATIKGTSERALDKAIEQMVNDFCNYVEGVGFKSISEWTQWLLKLEVKEGEKDKINPYAYYIEFTTTKEEDDPEPPDTPFPIPPPGHYHTGPLGDKCGEWKCSTCGAKFDPNGYKSKEYTMPTGFSMTHDFQWSMIDGKPFCKQCVNERPDNHRKCETYSLNENDHTGWAGTKFLQEKNDDKTDTYPSKYQFTSGNKEYAYVETCANGSHSKDSFVREHAKLVATNIWFKGDERSEHTRGKCMHVHFCNNKRFPSFDEYDDICGFGIPYRPYNTGGEEEMFNYQRAGVWYPDSEQTNNGKGGDEQNGHYYRRPEYLGLPNSWSNESTIVCREKRICAHDRKEIAKGVYENCGCGAEKWIDVNHVMTNKVRSLQYDKDQQYRGKTYHYVDVICDHCGRKNRIDDIYHKFGPWSVTNVVKEGGYHTMIQTRKCEEIYNNFGEEGWGYLTILPCGYVEEKQTDYKHRIYRDGSVFSLGEGRTGLHSWTNRCHDCEYMKVITEGHDFAFSSMTYENDSFHLRNYKCKECPEKLSEEELHYVWYLDDELWDQHDFIGAIHDIGTNCFWGCHKSSTTCEKKLNGCGGEVHDDLPRMCDPIWDYSQPGVDRATCMLCQGEWSTPCHWRYGPNGQEGSFALDEEYHACWHTVDTSTGLISSEPHLKFKHNAEGWFDQESGMFRPGWCSVCGYPTTSEDTWKCTDSVIEAFGYSRAFINSGYRDIDMFDPVYEVCESGFEKAFMYSEHLENINCGALTNAHKRAFLSAFEGCRELKNINFRKLQIAEKKSFSCTFSNCITLADASLNDLKIAGDSAFENSFFDCVKLDRFYAPSLKTACDNSFLGAFKQTKGYYPSFHNLLMVNFDSLETISNRTFESAFEGCTELTDFKLPSLTSAGDGAFDKSFDGCTSLTNFSLPSLTSLPDNSLSQTFVGCSNLACVDLSSLGELGTNCLMNYDSPVPEGPYDVDWRVGDVVASNCVCDLSSVTSVGANTLENLAIFRTIKFRNLKSVSSDNYPLVAICGSVGLDEWYSLGGKTRIFDFIGVDSVIDNTAFLGDNRYFSYNIHPDSRFYFSDLSAFLNFGDGFRLLDGTTFDSRFKKLINSKVVIRNVRTYTDETNEVVLAIEQHYSAKPYTVKRGSRIVHNGIEYFTHDDYRAGSGDYSIGVTEDYYRGYQFNWNGWDFDQKEVQAYDPVGGTNIDWYISVRFTDDEGRPAHNYVIPD